MTDAVHQADDLPISPGPSYCRHVSQLYEPAAHEIISRLCRPLLDEAKITPTELLHLPAHQVRLFNTGSLFQQAVQRVALTRARTSPGGAPALMREIFALVDRAVQGTVDRFRDNPPALFEAGQFTALVGRITTNTPTERHTYEINLHIARHLVELPTWNDKIARLMALWQPEADETALACIDTIIGEVLGGDTALRELIGRGASLGRCLTMATDLLCGALEEERAADEPLSRLAALLAANEMPATRRALRRQISRGLGSRTPLASDAPGNELRFQVRLLAKLREASRFVGGEPVIEAAEARLARLLSFDNIHVIYGDVRELDARMQALLDLHQAVSGPAARQQIRAYLDHLYGAERLPEIMARGSEPPLQRLRRLAQLHKSVMAADLAGAAQRRYAADLDHAQADLIRKTRFFDTLEQRGDSSAQRAMRILALCEAGVIIAGESLAIARERIAQYVKKPDFATSFVASIRDPDEAARKLATLRLKLAGIDVQIAANS